MTNVKLLKIWKQKKNLNHISESEKSVGNKWTERCFAFFGIIWCLKLIIVCNYKAICGQAKKKMSWNKCILPRLSFMHYCFSILHKNKVKECGHSTASVFRSICRELCLLESMFSSLSNRFPSWSVWFSKYWAPS